MTAIVVDTNAVIWFLSEPSQLSVAAKNIMSSAVLNGSSIFIPSMTVIELIYLTEKGKIAKPVLDRLISALSNSEYAFDLMPLNFEIAQVVQQVPRYAVPDLPDRVITATAMYLNLVLVTKDQKIRDFYKDRAIW